MKKLLLIKPDHIGDYILFRNFFKILKENNKYKNIHLTVILNERVKELAELLDQKIVDEFIFIELNKYSKKNWYYKKVNFNIYKNNYDYIINCMFSRFNSLELFIDKLKSKEKILIQDRTRKTAYELDKMVYNKFIFIEEQIFEFEKYKRAFEIIFQIKIMQNRPVLNFNNLKDNLFYDSKPFILIFMGADSYLRKYSAENYLEIISFLINSYNLNIYLCGANDEYEEAVFIQEKLNSPKIFNIVGETSLDDMLYLCKNCEMMISNETGMAHISTILGKTTFVISNGNHFGRFTPYPLEFDNYHAFYPFEIQKNKFDSYIELYYEKGSSLDINKIQTSCVIKKINNLIDVKYKKELKNDIKINSTKMIFLSDKQEKINYSFSHSFGHLYQKILDLKNDNYRYLIYGDSILGKVIKLILNKQIVSCVDQRSEKEYKKNDLLANEEIYSIDSINHIKFDKVIISVLGREKLILDFLINKCNIEKERIVLFKIVESRYIKC